MWKNMILYLCFAVGLVAGQWQPQDYGQNQLRPSNPGTPLDHGPVQPPVLPGQPTNMPHATPCRRRNFGDSGIILTESGWVPSPISKPPISQQSANQPFQPLLKPQSLTETRAPTVDDRQQKAEQIDRKAENPDKIYELVKMSSRPIQNSETQYREENEYKKGTPDQKSSNIRFDQVKSDQDSGPFLVDKRHYHDHTRPNDRMDPLEDSLECEDEEVNAEPRSGNPETKDLVSRPQPNEPYEKAEQIFSKCIHESRRSMSDHEGDLRSFEAGTPSSDDLDKMDTSITSKTGLKPNMQLMGTGKDVAKEYLQNPAKNAGAWHSGRQVSLLENGKVCYACSSYYDPSCWKTNATTTIKYCNRDNNACLTKTYKIDGISILIRDCGHTCNVDDEYNIGQKMTSCSMCHNDMCNSAYAVRGLHALLVTFIMFTLKITLQ